MLCALLKRVHLKTLFIVFPKARASLLCGGQNSMLMAARIPCLVFESELYSYTGKKYFSFLLIENVSPSSAPKF